MGKLKQIAILLSLLLFLTGCAEVLLIGAGAGLGVGSYMYVDGRLAVEYPLTYEKAWNASNRALENKQISISESRNEDGEGVIKAVRKDGKTVSVKIKSNDSENTVIAIRVGTLGDRNEARKIPDEITSEAGI
jgi:hypothetical protein